MQEANAALAILSTDPDLQTKVDALVSKHRAVIFVGIPSTGKSLMTNFAVHRAATAGRKVASIQWDTSGMAFKHMSGAAPSHIDSSEDTYVMRHAVGHWARGSIAQWAATNTAPEDILIGEAPFVDNRLIELTWKMTDDPAEPFLSSDSCVFVCVVPNAEVREAICAMRAARMDKPLHENEKEDCPVEWVHKFWEEIAVIPPSELHTTDPDQPTGIFSAADSGSDVPASTIDPKVWNAEQYKAVIARALRHRHFEALPVENMLSTEQFSPYFFSPDVEEKTVVLTPTQEEVTRFMALATAVFQDEALQYSGSVRRKFWQF